MHIAGILASLAAFAVAAPLDKRMGSSVKGEMTQPQVQNYASYGAYYLSYGDYPSAEDAKTAAMDLTKRGYSCYTSYTPYPAAMEDHAAQSGMMHKREYGTYSPYCVYGSAVEAEAMNMGKAKQAKRHMGMAMPKEMIIPVTEDTGMTEKQDMSADMGNESGNGAHNDEYYSYE